MQIVRSAGGAAIVRPHSHERPVLIRYLNAGADGLMVPMVDTAEQARAIVDAVRYALPADYEKRLVICMIETLEAIDNLDEMLAVDGIVERGGTLRQCRHVDRHDRRRVLRLRRSRLVRLFAI